MRAFAACIAALLPGLWVLQAAAQPALTPAAQADRVGSLPVWGDLDLDMFAGYLDVGGEGSVPQPRVFYSLTESEGDPSTDPLVLWLQGGPGCSPVGMATFKLNGPFLFKPDRRNTSALELERNPGSWTAAASLLYLDTPLWTGFSSAADNSSGRYWDDANATALNLDALLAFYDRFPQYRARPLYLTGHSYGGHFIPLLAEAVLEYNDNLPSGAQPIPLEGYAVGNAWTDPALDNAGAVEFWYSLGAVSEETYKGLKANCDMETVVLWRTDGESGVEGKCAVFREAALNELGAGYDAYGVNAPTCLLGDDGEPLEQQPQYADVPSPTFDPCSYARLTTYMNRADVQEALHAIQPGDQPLSWTECNSRGITYSYDSLATSMLPVHRKLIDAGLRAMVYSGDSDAVVPTRSSRSWVESLGLRPAGEHRPWLDAATNETAGYVTPYEGLALVTVHDAGHEAPYYKPTQALQMMRAFLEGRLP